MWKQEASVQPPVPQGSHLRPQYDLTM